MLQLFLLLLLSLLLFLGLALQSVIVCLETSLYFVPLLRTSLMSNKFNSVLLLYR